MRTSKMCALMNACGHSIDHKASRSLGEGSPRRGLAFANGDGAESNWDLGLLLHKSKADDMLALEVVAEPRARARVANATLACNTTVIEKHMRAR